MSWIISASRSGVFRFILLYQINLRLCEFSNTSYTITLVNIFLGCHSSWHCHALIFGCAPLLISTRVYRWNKLTADWLLDNETVISISWALYIIAKCHIDIGYVSRALHGSQIKLPTETYALLRFAVFYCCFVKSTLLRWLLDRNISDAIVRSFVIVVSSERSLQNLWQSTRPYRTC